MADDRAARRGLRVWCSGDLYLVARGDVGRLVPTDGRPAYPPDDVQAILAHCNVPDPWVPVPAGTPVPEAVQKAVDSFP